MKKFVSALFFGIVMFSVVVAEETPAPAATAATVMEQVAPAAPPVAPAEPAVAPAPVVVAAPAPVVKPAPVTVVSGYVRLRALALEKDVNTFRFDEWSFRIDKKLSDKVDAVVGLLWYPSASAAATSASVTNGFPGEKVSVTVPAANYSFLEHAYVDFKDMPLKGVMRVGATRNYCFGLVPAFPNRKTTNYGMVSDAFTHDRILGIQYLAKIKPFDVNIAIHNGYDLGARYVGEGASKVAITADRDKNFASIMRNDTDKSKEGSARIAFAPDKSLNIGISGSSSRLCLADVATLNAAIGKAYTNRTKTRAGLDFMVTKMDPVIFQGEYYKGWTSELEHSAYQGLVGYMIKKDKKPWIDVYARYGEIKPDIAASASTSRQQTWTLSQTVLSCLYRFTPGAQLQLELENNDEKDRSTANKVYNNAAILELTFFY